MTDSPGNPPRFGNSPQIDSPTYRLAALDQDFLLSREMRGVRFLLEYEKVDRALQNENIRSTIVVFGSARIREDGPGKQAFWYQEARTFGRIASERGGACCDPGEPHRHVITTGGGPGAMEAANRGAREAGAPTIGFNIRLPFEQEPNPYTTPELTFNFHYFAMRKMHLAMRANAMAVFPGGFGTMDEMFEILTLVQTGKAPCVPIILFGRSYWQEVVNFDALVRHGMINADDLKLFDFADDAEEAWQILIRRGLKAHAPAPMAAGEPSLPVK